MKETLKQMHARVIRGGMNARNWRAEHLAVHSGLPKSTIDAILYGRRRMSDEQRARINAAFGWDDGWQEPDENTIDDLTNDEEMTDEADQSRAAQS